MRVVNGGQQGRLDDQSTPVRHLRSERVEENHQRSLEGRDQQGRLDDQSTPDSSIRQLRSERVEENQQRNLDGRQLWSSERNQPESLSRNRFSSMEDSVSMEWKQVIVGFFFDSKLGFRQVERYLRGKWKLKGSLCINADKEMVYLRFTSEEDRKQALEEVPMFINGRVFVLREWSANVANEKMGCKSLPIWVIFRDIPKFLWNKEGFSHLASCMGTPLFADSITMKRKRMGYARLCVEVNSDFKFPEKLEIKSGPLEYEIEVEYQWIPPKCRNCESFGHHFHMCKEPKRNTTDTEIDEATEKRVEENQGTEGNGDVQVHGNNENRTDVEDWFAG